MSDEFRDRNIGISTDWERNDHHEAMRETWLKDALTEKHAIPVLKLVMMHYKGGNQKPVKMHRGMYGSYNANWRVEFEEGSAILHIPMPGRSAFFDEKIRAEVATMKMIEARTTIPVPHIYHWGYAADNPTGLGPFIIMDYIEHERNLADLVLPANNPSWNINLHGMDPNASEETLLKVYRQMANIWLQLSTLEMPCIGSPSFDETSQSFKVHGRPVTENLTGMLMDGGNPRCALPAETKIFATSKEYYSALADMHLAELAFQYNGGIDSYDDCRDKYVARQLFRRLCKDAAFLDSDEEEEPFKLWCDDMRPSSVLLNEHNDVVGVIDWEFAYFAPASFTYDPPWWTILGKFEVWEKGLDDYSAKFDQHVPLLLKAMEMEEERMEKEAKEEPPEVGASVLSFYLGELELNDAKPRVLPKLSEKMKKHWETGRHYLNYAARNSWAFDPIFWKYIDQRFFGQNVRGGFEDRLQLFSESQRKRMEDFVERKIAQLLDAKLKIWDEQECKEYLEDLLKDR
ncbi:hypothetical protein KVR01_013364 [Diaporthe batatas]|uniref:uncharacterized protein n=1 Tax=Diaporthe batatas TaxID=748121 RepID=UPI001D05197A|nr:uncharacterized protein KVR01_013364 [Diaporthe batatas]KAG8156759.1 hypothetical protein KVR01_013364 [Diaporthe batatas]